MIRNLSQESSGLTPAIRGNPVPVGRTRDSSLSQEPGCGGMAKSKPNHFRFGVGPGDRFPDRAGSRQPLAAHLPRLRHGRRTVLGFRPGPRRWHYRRGDPRLRGHLQELRPEPAAPASRPPWRVFWSWAHRQRPHRLQPHGPDRTCPPRASCAPGPYAASKWKS